MQSLSLRCLFCCVLLLFTTNTVYGTPKAVGKPTQVDEMPADISMSDVLNYLRLREMEDAMEGETNDLDALEKRARFHPRLGKRPFHFRSRLGEFFPLRRGHSLAF